MEISIRADIAEASAFVADVHKRHIPFAAIRAATMTAKAVKLVEIQAMRESFDRPTDYVLNSLRVDPATKSKPITTVEFKDFTTKGTPAKRFLNPNIHGGPRSQKSHELSLAALMGSTYLVPGKDMPLDAHGNLAAATIKRIVSQLGVSRDPTQNASNSKRSKAARKSNAFYKLKDRPIIMQRIGDTVRPALIGVRAPQYRERYPFFELARATVEREFPIQFSTSLGQAIAKSNRRGKW